MPEGLSGYIAAIAAAFFVGLGKGGLANFGVVAVPIMSLVMSPLAAAGLLLPIYVISDAIGVWLYRHNFSARNLKIIIPAGFVGIGVGWLLARHISDDLASLIVGLLGCGFVAVMIWRRRRAAVRRPADVPRGLFWGVATGFTSFLTHSGAATFQIFVLPQGLEKKVFAGTSTITFAAINLGKIGPYWFLGQLSPSSATTGLVLIPIAVAGTFLGAWATRRLPELWFFRVVQTALLLVSVLLLIRSL